MLNKHRVRVPVLPRPCIDASINPVVVSQHGVDIQYGRRQPLCKQKYRYDWEESQQRQCSVSQPQQQTADTQNYHTIAHIPNHIVPHILAMTPPTPFASR